MKASRCSPALLAGLLFAAVSSAGAQTVVARVKVQNPADEPMGLSLAELADGLPDSTGPQARGQVRAALDAVGQSSSSWGQGFTRSTSF